MCIVYQGALCIECVYVCIVYQMCVNCVLKYVCGAVHVAHAIFCDKGWQGCDNDSNCHTRASDNPPAVQSSSPHLLCDAPNISRVDITQDDQSGKKKMCPGLIANNPKVLARVSIGCLISLHAPNCEVRKIFVCSCEPLACICWIFQSDIFNTSPTCFVK